MSLQAHPTASHAAFSAAPVVDEEEDILQLTVATISGKSAMLSTTSSASIEGVRVTIEKLIGVPNDYQQWVVDDEEVPLQNCNTFADTQIRHGGLITVAHTGCMGLARMPEAFHLTLTSARERFDSRFSSAFTIVYEVFANVPEGRMRLEMWRKNDHDKWVYDTKAGTVLTAQSHWMAGTSESTSDLNGRDPLGDLRRGWHAPTKRIQEEDDLFWLRGNLVSDQKGKECIDDADYIDRDSQDCPNHFVVPGWFTLPSEDLVEIKVDIPLHGKRISRLLIDGDGQAVRAAVHGCKMAGLHEDIEEYDLQIFPLSAADLAKAFCI
jgi:hypothetical protein